MRKRLIYPALVSASVLALAFTAGCRKSEPPSAWWQRENERLELVHALALKEYRYQQTGVSKVAEYEAARAAADAGKKKLQELTHRQAALTSEVSSMESQLVGLREDFIKKQRHLAMGRKFKEFSIADGRTFKDATVAAIDDAGVTIRHTDGSARLGYHELDDDQRRFFGLDEETSLAAQREEKRQAAAYEQWIDGTVAVNREKEERALAAVQRQVIQARQQRSAMAADLTASASTRALAQPARPFGSDSSRFYSVYYTRPRYRSVYYYTPTYYPNYRYGYSYSYGCGYSPRAPYRPSTTTTYGRTNFKSFANTTIQDIP